MIAVDLQSLIESDLRVTDDNGDELMGAERREFLAMIAKRIDVHEKLVDALKSVTSHPPEIDSSTGNFLITLEWEDAARLIAVLVEVKAGPEWKRKRFTRDQTVAMLQTLAPQGVEVIDLQANLEGTPALKCVLEAMRNLQTSAAKAGAE